MRSAEYQRGYDAGYKQALLDALAKRQSSDLPMMGPGPLKRLEEASNPYTGLPRPRREVGVPVVPKHFR